MYYIYLVYIYIYILLVSRKLRGSWRSSVVSFVQISYYSLKRIVTLFANKKEKVFLWEKLNRRKSFHETSVSFL